jgi:hypothetical protein
MIPAMYLPEKMPPAPSSDYRCFTCKDEGWVSDGEGALKPCTKCNLDLRAVRPRMPSGWNHQLEVIWDDDLPD